MALTTACLLTGAQSKAPDCKGVGNGNPISASVFCADPTALEYNGRLYVYGTNDNQQYIVNNKKGENGYGGIKSLVVFSTDDMVNWTFHGTIDVGKLCASWGWRFAASWAPSVTWRTNVRGKDEFFLYFANSGGSVGVLKAASPVGPWSSPLTKPMIDGDTPGVKPCNWIFDPGVVIDGSGTGWIAFGGGDPQPTGSSLMPGNSRIAKLAASMTALDGLAVDMPAPYLFEASELNIIGGRYVYTYNTSWSGRDDWTSYAKRNGQPAPSSCSMCYMVSDTPLVPDSWEYRGEYVPNEGNFGMGWGNNHTHLHLYEGRYYLLYHSTLLQQNMKDNGVMDSEASGYRSICVNMATVNEATQTINKMTLTTTGVAAVRSMNPYLLQQAETMANCGGITYEDFSNIERNTAVSTMGNDASENMQVNMRPGSWVLLYNLAFGTEGAGRFMLRARGEGTVEVRVNRIGGKAAATIDVASSAMSDYEVDVDPAKFVNQKNLYLYVPSGSGVYVDAWQFKEGVTDGLRQTVDDMPAERQRFDLQGRRLSDASLHHGIVIERYSDGRGVVHSSKMTTR